MNAEGWAGLLGEVSFRLSWDKLANVESIKFSPGGVCGTVLMRMDRKEIVSEREFHVDMLENAKNPISFVELDVETAGREMHRHWWRGIPKG